MLLSRNIKAYRGKRTKHINIRDFFVTDQIANKEISVEYLPIPIDDILGDFFTKLTQGELFSKLRKSIINLWADYLYRYDTKISQECVGYTYPT